MARLRSGITLGHRWYVLRLKAEIYKFAAKKVPNATPPRKTNSPASGWSQCPVMVVFIAGQELEMVRAESVMVVESLQGVIVLVIVALREAPGNTASVVREETPISFSIGSTVPQGMETMPPLDIWKHSSTVLISYLVSDVIGAGSGAWIG